MSMLSGGIALFWTVIRHLVIFLSFLSSPFQICHPHFKSVITNCYVSFMLME